MTKRTLNEHRQNLRHIEPQESEINRLRKSLRNHIDKQRFRCRYSPGHIKTLNLIINMILETQDRKPFFWINTSLPMCWNHPWNWDMDYIKYEWGHVGPINSSPEKYNDIENLCLMSARCNNHIQSSLCMDDLLEFFEGSRIADRIRYVLDRRQKLFASSEWRDVIACLEVKPQMQRMQVAHIAHAPVLAHCGHI